MSFGITYSPSCTTPYTLSVSVPDVYPPSLNILSFVKLFKSVKLKSDFEDILANSFSAKLPI